MPAPSAPSARQTVPGGRTVLDGLALIRIDGPDAATFLQSQFTSDVASLQSGHWHWTGYCSPKGRLIATGRLLRDGPVFHWQVPSDVRDDVAARLRRFVMRSKVSLAPAAVEWEAFLLTGAEALAATGRELRADLAADRVGVATPGALLFALDDACAALYLDRRAMPALAATIDALPDSQANRAAIDLHAGLPWIVTSTQDAFVPQMVDLDVIGGVSFAKGCYPGQEIVARSRYLGEVKRRLHFARAAAAAQPGDGLEANGHAAGKVLASVPGADGSFDVLAVIDTEAASGGHLLLAGTATAVTDVRRSHPPVSG